jgi:hypothetical protein
VRNGLLSLGVVFVLLFTTVLAVKIFWWVTITEFDPILLDYLQQVLKSKNSGHTAI